MDNNNNHFNEHTRFIIIHDDSFADAPDVTWGEIGGALFRIAFNIAVIILSIYLLYKLDVFLDKVFGFWN